MNIAMNTKLSIYNEDVKAADAIAAISKSGYGYNSTPEQI